MTLLLLLATLSTTPPRAALLELHRRNVHAPNTAEEDRVWAEIVGKRGRR